MRVSVFEKLWAVAASNLRHNFAPYFALCVLMLFLAPFFFGTANMDAKAAAVPLEMFVSLTGIVLLVPVFLPEQSEEIRGAVEAKATDQILVDAVRVGISLLAMLALAAAFVLYLKGNGCEVNVPAAIFGTFSGGLFLGALGLLACGLSNSATVGYMFPMVYYMLNLFLGSKSFGRLYLFSMESGSMAEKYALFAAGMGLTVATLLLKKAIRAGR